MRKKIRVAILLIILFVIAITTIFFEAKKNNTKQFMDINNHDNKDMFYFNEATNELNSKDLVLYLMYNNDFDNLPVTLNYINKHKNILVDEFNLQDFILNAETTMNRELRVEYDSDADGVIVIEAVELPYNGANRSNIFRILKLKYDLNDKGYLDNIFAISDEYYRTNDGEVIIIPNRKKFIKDITPNDYYIDLIYGKKFVKYRYDLGIDMDIPKDEIEQRFNEYALTDNLRNKYSIEKGLLNNEFVNDIIKSNLDIELKMDKLNFSDSGFPVKIITGEFIEEKILKVEITNEGYLNVFEFVE